MKNRNILLSLAFGSALLFASCESTSKNMTLRDAEGNYVTTSDYRAMNRSEFFRSMNAGVADFDEQLTVLRDRANKLGGETLQEFAECEDDLMVERTEFVNQLAIARNARDENWPDQRSETVDSYEDLREALNEAYDDVLN